MTPLRSLHRPALALATAGIGVLALTGCGSAGGSTGTPTTSASALAGGGFPGRTGGRVPGVSGTIAAVDGRTLQVQDTSAQTAVVYTAKTTITARVATTSSAMAVGDCVSVRTAASTSTASTSPGAANAGTAPLAATTVTILSTTGGCSALGGGRDGGGFPGGGTPPSGMPSGAPSGMPSGRPSGDRAGGFGFGTIGEVTTLASGSFTVTRTMPAFGGRAATSATPTAAPSASGTPVAVTYTDATTFLTTSKAKASSIKVGLCVRATGATDDTGKLTATTMLLSQPVDGSCTSGVRGG